MRQQLRIAAIVATAGLCAPAFAQDSTSNNQGGLPGDALNPWNVNSAAYVVDLAPVTTSKGTTFGVAPLLKTTKVDETVFIDDQFFGNLFGASTISPATLPDMPYLASGYSLWENAPGMGVNGTLNNAGSIVTPEGLSSRFGVALTEFGTTTGAANFNGIIGAFVNYDPESSNRLYVDRRQVAVNTPSEFDGDSAQIGGVSMDAHGNIYYRGDNDDSTGLDQLNGQNIFRTRLGDRSHSSMNHVSVGMTLDATDRLIVNYPDTLGVPNNIPARVAGGNGLAVNGNAFASTTEMFVSDTGTHTQTTGHLDMTGGIGGDHRGAFGSTTHDFLGNGADYTLSILAKDAQPLSSRTRILNVTSVDSTGAVIGNKGFEIPLSLTDNEDGYMLNYTGNSYVYNYTGAILFRGGIGHIAIGRDQAGRGLLAAMVNENGFSDDWANQIIVCRYDSATGMEEWTIAAYIDEATALDGDDPEPENNSKFICDANGDPIGQLTDLGDVTNGSIAGPGMSAPTIDSAGNIWFLCSVELFDRGPNGESDFDSALVRAIYDPATFSYKLEMILETGQVFAGPNSGTNYRVDFLGTSAGSGASPGTIYSGNMAEFAWNNTDISGVSPADPITNGGLMFGTTITYDTNGDGLYVDPSSGNYDPNSVPPPPPADESYSVGLYVGYYQDSPPPCPADLNGDGEVDFVDISFFVNNQFDMNGDTNFDFVDISLFVAAFTAGCP
jgi:hypothetical protein